MTQNLIRISKSLYWLPGPKEVTVPVKLYVSATANGISEGCRFAEKPLSDDRLEI
jgi:hypothetical protein